MEKCLICLSYFNQNEGNRFPCEHFCCKNCMFTYLKVQIESSNVEIKCFECNYELSEDFILDIIKKMKFL